jgi:hypothetical protein
MLSARKSAVHSFNGMQIFQGPWNAWEFNRFMNAQCARAAQIGRVYVADILASQFVRAESLSEQKHIYEGLKHMYWQYAESKFNKPAQQYMRYYLDIMEVSTNEIALRNRGRCTF